MNKSFKSLGLGLLLVLLLALAIRFALTALETKSGPTADPQGTIRKVERDLKAAQQAKTGQIQEASEAEEAPAPPPVE